MNKVKTIIVFLSTVSIPVIAIISISILFKSSSSSSSSNKAAAAAAAAKILKDTIPSITTESQAEWFTPSTTTESVPPPPNPTLAPKNEIDEHSIIAFNPGFFLPVLFPWTDPKDNRTYLNIAHFNGIHCPYDAKYIVNSYPPTFHKFCKSRRGELPDWEGYCMQTFNYERGLLENEDARIKTLVFNDCIFVPEEKMLLKLESMMFPLPQEGI